MKNKNILFIIIFLIILLFFVFYGNVKINKPGPSVKYFDIELRITNYTNVQVTENNVIFYSPPNKTISGEISIRNNEDKWSNIQISVSGDLQENNWLKLDEDSFKLDKGKGKLIKITLITPETAAGNYTSKLSIITS